MIENLVNELLANTDMSGFTGESLPEDETLQIDKNSMPCATDHNAEAEAIVVMSDSEVVHYFFLCGYCSLEVLKVFKAVVSQLGLTNVIQVGIVRNDRQEYHEMVERAKAESRQ